MAYLTGEGYQLGIDIADSTTYVTVDAISVDESFNETIDTFYKLGDGGFATSVVTAIDPEFSIVLKFESTDTLSSGILEKRFKVGDDRNVGLEIVDNATGNTITGSAVLTSISDPRVVESVIEISVSLKLRGEPTITETA